MKRGFAFRLFMIWAAWGLLALPANAERMFNTPFADLPGMVKRDRWQPNPGVPPQPVDWQKLLALKDLYWVIGNQSVLQIAPREHDSAIYANPLGVSRGSHPNILTSAPVQPGFELVTFFPLAVSDSTFRQITAMPGVISFQNADGKNLEVVNEVDKRVWRPDVQTDYFRVGDAVLRQEVTTSNDIFVLRIKAVSGKLPPKFSLRGNFGETKGALDVEQSGASTFVWGQEQEHSKTCFALWSAAPLQAPEVSAPGQILGYTLEGTSGDEITLAFGFGYRMADLEERMKAAAADPAGIFAEATRAWDEFFTRMVPFFDCDDQDYVRQYYFIFYCVYANFLDVPYQPLAFPYGVTSKLLWKDQNQPWNSGNDTLIMSWLSDKSLAEGNVLGPLRRGNWTISTGFPDLSNPVIKDVNEFRFFQNLSLYSFWWETYLKTRNKAWLEKVYPALVRHHDKMCQGLLGMAPLNARGLAPWGLDDWDASSRWMKWQADTRVDTSTYLVSSLECLQKMAEELGETEAAESHGKRAEEFRKKIRELLWDEKTNLFLDANLERGTFSPIHSSGSFIPLFARIPTPEQAAKLVENLVDPGKFWTPYPIPGLSLDMPDFKPDGANIGNGPIMAYTSGWFTTSGLVDYGYTGLAAEIVRRQIKMATVEGVSSPSKHNPITGEGLSWVPAVKQNNMLTTIHSAIADLIIRYVVGFRLRQDDLIEFDPIAAEKTWDRMKWGPFLYGERTVSLDYRKDHGMTIECDGAKYHAPSLQHVLLKLEDGKLIPVVPEPVPEIEVSFPDMASSGRPMGRPSARPSDAVARHWRFDGDADESTGSPLQGTVQGAVFGSGRLGQAAEFDGNRARVDMGATDLHLGNNFTIAFWFKAGEADGADQVILAKGEGEEGGFKVYRNPHGEIFFQAQGMGRSPTHYPVPEGKWPSGLVVNDGEWHHFAMVREPLEVSFYLDGQKVSTHVAGGVMKNHTAPFSVGAAVDGGQPYNGSLDELFILGWSLNPDEVKKLMENQYAL